MINFIKQYSKIKELYINKNTFNIILETVKKELINSKNTFLELAKMDMEKCNQFTNFENILFLLDTYKNENIVERKEKEVILATYYGSPYITINLCMQALLQKRLTIIAIEDSMLAINKLLIAIFNDVLNKYKISNMVKLFNLKSLEEIKQTENYVNSIICIGNSSTYYKYKKNGIKKIKYIPFKNMAIFCENDKYSELQRELYKFAGYNGIEAEIYEDDYEDFIECVNLDNKLEIAVILSESKEIIESAKNKIKNCKIYVNENPFKNQIFRLEKIG